MKKTFLLIMALVIASGILVGCSGGDSGGDGVEKTTGSTPTKKSDERGAPTSSQAPL